MLRMPNANKKLESLEDDITSAISKLRQNLNGSQNRVLILTAQTNDPKMLEMQAIALHRHLKMPYDFICALDITPSKNPWGVGVESLEEEFFKVSSEYKVQLLPIPQKIHSNRELFFPNTRFASNPNDFALRCANTLQFVLAVAPWSSYRSTLFMDGDLFPICDVNEVPVNPSQPLLGVRQERQHLNLSHEYLWPGLFWIDSGFPLTHLLNWDLSKRGALRTDVGGELSSWIRTARFLGIQVTFVNHLSSGSWSFDQMPPQLRETAIHKWISNDYRNTNNTIFSEIFDNKYFHYRGGGNWMRNNPKLEHLNRVKLLEAIAG